MIDRLFNKIAALRITPIQWIGIAFAIFIVRLTSESLSGNQGEVMDGVFIFLHGPLFFFSFGLALVIVLRLLTKAPLRELLNLILIGYCLILIVPFVDYIVSAGRGDIRLTYVMGSLSELGRDFITFFGKEYRVGVTPGARLEIFLLLVLIGFYLYHKLHSVKKLILGVVLVYVVAFVWAAAPSWVAMLISLPTAPWKVDGLDVLRTFVTPTHVFALPFALEDQALKFNRLMSFVLVVPLAINLVILGLLHSRKKLVAFARSLRPSRLVVQFSAFVIGGVAGLLLGDTAFDASFFGILVVITLCISILCAWIASVLINDYYDITADRLVHANRPLPQKLFAPEMYLTLFWIFAAAAIFCAAIIGYTSAVLMACVIALAYGYSAPPLRAKRFPLLATFLMALGLLFLLLLGFDLFSSSRTFFELPSQFIFLALLVPTLTLPIKDLRDVAGDKAQGVKTLPVLLGEQRARLVIAGLFALSYFLFPIFFKQAELAITAAIFAVFSALLILNKKVGEVPALAAYVLFLVVVGFTIF